MKMTIEEIIKSVEELNKRRGPKLSMFVQTYFNDQELVGNKAEAKVNTDFQFMVEDWQTEVKTAEEAAEFVLLWEKVHKYKWI